MPDKDAPLSFSTLSHYRLVLIRGFTLIELLIVMLIIGIILGFAVVQFDNFGSTRHAKILAEEFIEYIHLLQYQALLENRMFGVEWLSDGYQTLRLTSEGSWSVISERPLQKRAIPSPFIARLQTTQTSSTSHLPKVLIHPSGDVTTFRLEIGTTNTPQIATVLGDHNGELRVL